MLIEKRFFDIAKREDEEIKRELEAEKVKMTEEEKLKEKNRKEAEVKELIRKAEARMKKHKKIPDSKKIVEFTFLQKAALEIAEHMGMNIKTERKKDDLWGTIELAFDKMWFLDSTPPEWVDVWNSLLTEAHSVYIEIKDNMIVYQYSYDLSKEVIVE
ncbi:MAG: chemotaxis protein CheY [Blautia sp.]|uniref:chemotaxis protein CheY n=1 Tax=Blautia sp. TaxID=1955243 RepID=UPI002A75180B|nr:chemotaxis protein CheY [Blautia sp.]MDY3017434.1 chemotaxis protein CheY [Blautia sp.]